MNKVFHYKGFLLMKCEPARCMFSSKMVRDVVNRGDVFVVNIRTGYLTLMTGEMYHSLTKEGGDDVIYQTC
jgi:hypothetical protein